MIRPKKVAIMGAAGRDFHNFNVCFRGKSHYHVEFFTATQIPDIEGRSYPAELAGTGYEQGIPIYPESELPHLIKQYGIEEVVFSYSDVPHEYVMHKASMCLAAGADFIMLGPNSTMLESEKPVISVTAVRTGVGKSQTTRRVLDILKDMGLEPTAVRHPMPYGKLDEQISQRFATYHDLVKHHCTIEEREEYEPIIDRGLVVWAGVDYEKILRSVEKEADIILWDGGNNDLPFYKSDIHIVLVDPHRPGHEEQYHPGEANLRMAHIVVINKVDTASPEGVERVRESIDRLNPDAVVIEAASPIFVDDPNLIRGKNVLVVEDGPTLTHGEMAYGAGVVAAKKYRAKSLVDPRQYAVGSISDTFNKYPRIGAILPAMGYGDQQVRDLEETIKNTPCDSVVVATPIDISRVTKIDKPWTRVRYELQEIGRPTLEDVLREMGGKLGLWKPGFKRN
jgi:predicted GTPase